ncbi:hypothetical protein FCH30_15185 [Acinetobacter radioresistens]|uniref:hypothetical protein n=1 Tax=Acinetobacter radioresistens TaxID=40216 RepID=UPI00157AC677|nr:hypothetical protein [Acinetobacter radioresistens]NTY98546.1 hypothetical protein [Acinetobacter radioresistens]
MSKKDYPKMLYQGNLQVFKTAIAENEDHESELKKQNWIEYGELEEPEKESEGVEHGIGSSALNSLDDIERELGEVTSERDKLRSENERLNDVIISEQKENVQLRKKIRAKEIEDLSADDLRQILDDRKITYGARTGKPELVSMVLESEEELNEGQVQE